MLARATDAARQRDVDREVSRGRSSEEVTVMVTERRTEQIYQLLKLNLYSCMVLEKKGKLVP